MLEVLTYPGDMSNAKLVNTHSHIWNNESYLLADDR
jgi:hypothetical protein